MANLVPLLLLIALIGPPSAPLHTSPSLSDLAFLSGCWEGSFQSQGRSGTMEEFYTTPSDNVMLGTSRFILDGRTIDYEFAAILADSSGIVLRPFPSGVQSTDDFRLTKLEGEHVVFESPEHDYPKRIHYWSTEDGGRIARIDGGVADAEGREWKLRAVACPAGSSSGDHEHE